MAVAVVDENSPLLPVSNDAEQSSRKISPRAFKIILSCLYANVFLASVDSTMVATLLGKMASDLDSQEHIAWVATSYLLSCAAFQPLFGKISDVFGRKPVILFSTVCFFFGCLMCGMGGTLTWLIIGRLITGIGGGGFTSLATISISDLVSTKERGLYQGYVNIFFHAGSASGGVLAGIIDSMFGWEWAFLIQLPVCFLTGIAVYLWFDLPVSDGDGDSKKTHWQKFIQLDWIGAALLVTSLLSLMVISGTKNSELPTDSALWRFLLFYTVVGFITFYFWEKQAAEPVIPVNMLHNRTVLASSINCWFACMNMFSSLFYLPFYWTSVKNVSPLDAGLRLIPGSIMASFTSIFAGWMIKKTGRYRSMHIIAAWMMLLGSVFIFASSKYDGWLKDSVVSIPLRYGTSANTTIILIAMISAVKATDQALVTSIQYGFRSTGSTMGVSIASALLQFVLSSSLDSNFMQLLQKVPEGWNKEMLASAKLQALESPNYAFTSDLPHAVQTAIVSSYDRGCHAVFLFLIATAIGSLICIYLTEENDLEDKK